MSARAELRAMVEADHDVKHAERERCSTIQSLRHDLGKFAQYVLGTLGSGQNAAGRIAATPSAVGSVTNTVVRDSPGQKHGTHPVVTNGVTTAAGDSAPTGDIGPKPGRANMLPPSASNITYKPRATSDAALRSASRTDPLDSMSTIVIEPKR